MKKPLRLPKKRSKAIPPIQLCKTLSKDQRFEQLKPEQVLFAAHCAKIGMKRGSLSQFAQRVGVSRQTLHNWLNNRVIWNLRNELMSINVSSQMLEKST